MKTTTSAIFIDMMTLDSRKTIKLHSKTYQLPTSPTVVVCVDGFDPEYLTQGVEAGTLRNLAKCIKHGYHTTARSAMPSFTNPNNVSIITGVPPSVHGIAGNFFLDRETNKETMIQDDSLLRGSTILSEMGKRGVRVAAVTAKDKLRKILAHGLTKDTICFSAEASNTCTIPITPTNGDSVSVEKWLGQPRPSVYSADLSLFVLDSGIKLLEEDRADLFYLTLSDYIQHKYAPGSKEANAFMTALDARIGKLSDLGANVAVTGDHGMSDKSLENGTPNVLFLQDILEDKWGKTIGARVICPITDPYVKHHGALGSFVRIYLTNQPSDSTVSSEMLTFIKTLPGIEAAYSREEASKIFECPYDIEGDIVVVSAKNVVLGSKREEHDLKNLEGHRLRSHGGLSEQLVPLLMNREIGTVQDRKDWRNFDVFDLVLNCQKTG